MKEFHSATCRLLVDHFYNIANLDSNGYGFNSRIFTHILHPENKFILAGYSQESLQTGERQLEHIVPCKVLYEETRRLLSEGRLTRVEISELLQKHWRVAYISSRERKCLDSKHKCDMPIGWCFETGDTLERLKLANIQLEPSCSSVE